MTNKQFIFTSEINREPFATVYELRDEVPSFEEFMKTYEGGTNYDDLENSDISETRGYGPCNCSNSNKCRCNYTKYRGGLFEKTKRTIKISGKKVNVRGCQHLIHESNDWVAKKGISRTTKCELWDEETVIYSDKDSFWFSNIATSAGANWGDYGAIVSGGAEFQLFRLKESRESEIRVLDFLVGGEIGIGLGGAVAGYSLGVDIVSVQKWCFQANAGVDVGGGVAFGLGGIEVKVGGMGISIGKKTGVSSPFMGFSVDLGKVCKETCVVQ